MISANAGRINMINDKVNHEYVKKVLNDITITGNHVRERQEVILQAYFNQIISEGAHRSRENILKLSEDTGADAFGIIVQVWKINGLTEDEMLKE